MLISSIEIGNFRKLQAVRVELAATTTLFVGANNSGKTSAMLALRHFLFDKNKFSTYDFTLCHWPAINIIGSKWERISQENGEEVPIFDDWQSLLPFLDVWLNVADDEIHFVSKILPTLEWEGGLLGVRLRLEPENVQEFFKDYVTAVNDVKKTMAEAKAELGEKELEVKLWPQNMIEFLERKLNSHFKVRSYVLDPNQIASPENGVARPQILPSEVEPIEGNPFDGLIRIDEINAQRGFGYSTNKVDGAEDVSSKESRKLSNQLRSYYANHLDPFDKPDASDLQALHAMSAAQAAFDDRLSACFEAALEEVEELGYPGVTDPRLRISTRIRAIDGLNHDAAVQYEVNVKGTESAGPSLYLPEEYNGLGYQNLISMIFRLMSFRDAWMRVGKASKNKGIGEEKEANLPPLHLVLVEEPEAHLHAQVQQVFIRKAYEILRAHEDLGESKLRTTQLVVSTHSSHVAHETSFSSLRYFRRLPAGIGAEVPVSTVINLSGVFGDDTHRFVKRYIRTTHCDLFFADAAILVEGPAERMLVPYFVRNKFKFLNQSYITWLEIGGSHSHRLEPLIKELGLPTLIITDIDGGNADSRVAEPSMRNKKQITNNATLRTWIPKLESVDELLAAADEQKVIIYSPLSAIRVAYQGPIKVRINDKDMEALASTFEDALVLENLSMFKTLNGTGLIKKFRDSVVAASNATTLAEALFEALKTGKKAEFALDLLDLEEADKLAVPSYINEGLTWLQKQLERKVEKERIVSKSSAKDGKAKAA